MLKMGASSLPVMRSSGMLTMRPCGVGGDAVAQPPGTGSQLRIAMVVRPTTDAASLPAKAIRVTGTTVHRASAVRASAGNESTRPSMAERRSPAASAR
jgi:hypothetical protein